MAEPKNSRIPMQQMIGDDLPKLANRYFVDEVAGRSLLTLEARLCDLQKFFDFYQELNGHLQACELQPRDAKLFMGHLHTQGYAANSINRAMGSLRVFGKWLQSNGYVRVHPCNNIRDLQVEMGLPKAPRDKEFHRLLKAAQLLVMSDPGQAKQHYRDLVLVETLNSSGLRISEILNVKLSQFHGRKLVNVQCKGSKIRSVLIKQSAADLINAYIAEYRIPGTDYLFTSKTGRKLDRVTVWKSFTRIGRIASAKFPDEQPIVLAPHRLRHRHAYQARKIKDPVFAAKRLGHSSLNFIQRYSGETAAEEIELVDAME